MLLRRCASSAAKFRINPVNVFDTSTKLKQRQRAALLPDHHVYDYLRDEVASDIVERICDVKRKFEKVVDFGCGRGHLACLLTSDMAGSLVQCDTVQSILDQAAVSDEVPTETRLIDPEEFPFEENSLDLVVSSLCLHWVNDLPAVFEKIHRALKPDGCFLGAMLGGDTLFELRSSLQLAEMERHGGFSPHVSPFTDNQDLAGLLSSARFTLLTLDIDEYPIRYPSMFELMHDLKGMGENNCAWNRSLRLNKDTLVAAAAIYKEMFGSGSSAAAPTVADGGSSPPSSEGADEVPVESVPATFQVLHCIGWKPDPASQTQPAARGSGEVSMRELHRLDQIIEEKRNPKNS